MQWGAMEQCWLTLTGASPDPPSPVDESSEVDKNAGVDRNSVKLVYESSVVVENTGLKLEGLDEKAVVVFSLFMGKTNSKLDFLSLAPTNFVVLSTAWHPRALF